MGLAVDEDQVWSAAVLLVVDIAVVDARDWHGLTSTFSFTLSRSSLSNEYYKSGPQAILDVMGDFVSMTFLSTTLTVPPAKAGKVQALGVTSPKRLPQLPDLPTIAETVPGYEASWWYGLFAPLGTPPDIITTINTGSAENPRRSQLQGEGPQFQFLQTNYGFARGIRSVRQIDKCEMEKRHAHSYGTSPKQMNWRRICAGWHCPSHNSDGRPLG